MTKPDRSAAFRPIGAALAAALLCLAPRAHAQDAAASPASDGPIVTLQGENDAVSTQKGTSDRYYTSGLRLGYVSATGAVGPVNSLSQALWGDAAARLSLELSQAIYTPANTQISPPDAADRPYAAVLMLTTGIVHDTANRRDQFSLGLGVAGPSALGRQVQNGFHNLIGDPDNKGWDYQVPDQPAVQLAASRIWRLPVANFGGIEADALPGVGASLGDVRIALQAGGVLRIGQGLAGDFGPTRIGAGPAGYAVNGGDAYTTVTPFGWSLFAGVDGQAVAYDYAIDGAAFRDTSPRAHRVWDQGGIIAGVSMQWHGVRLSYTQTWRTQETPTAKPGLFNFGSLAASVRF